MSKGRLHTSTSAAENSPQGLCFHEILLNSRHLHTVFMRLWVSSQLFWEFVKNNIFTFALQKRGLGVKLATPTKICISAILIPEYAEFGNCNSGHILVFTLSLLD